jgi:CRP-like cAMP-binding protein
VIEGVQAVELGPIETMHAMRRMFGIQRPMENRALAALAQLTRPLRVAAGTVLAHEGQPFGDVYLIIDGMLELTRKGHRIGTYGPRTGVGLLSALAHDENGFACTSVHDSTVLSIRPDDLLEVLEDYFDMMHGAMGGLARDAIALRRGLLPDAGFVFTARPAPNVDKPLGLVQRILHLRHTVGFESSDIDQLSELARASEEVRFAAGTRLWSAGDPADYLLIVVSGLVHAHSPEGAQFRLGPGDILGNLDTAGGEPRWFSAEVSEDLVALRLGGESMLDIWEDHPSIGFAFLQMLARLIIQLRVQRTDMKIEAL